MCVNCECGNRVPIARPCPIIWQDTTGLFSDNSYLELMNRYHGHHQPNTPTSFSSFSSGVGHQDTYLLFLVLIWGLIVRWSGCKVLVHTVRILLVLGQTLQIMREIEIIPLVRYRQIICRNELLRMRIFNQSLEYNSAIFELQQEPVEQNSV